MTPTIASMEQLACRRTGSRFDPWTDFQLQLIAGERRAGVPLLAGSDYPNAELAPGSGLVEELRALGDAGLTPTSRSSRRP